MHLSTILSGANIFVCADAGKAEASSTVHNKEHMKEMIFGILSMIKKEITPDMLTNSFSDERCFKNVL
jgi:hypothetical protein